MLELKTTHFSVWSYLGLSILSILKTRACLKPHLLRCGGSCFFDGQTTHFEIWYHKIDGPPRLKRRGLL